MSCQIILALRIFNPNNPLKESEKLETKHVIYELTYIKKNLTCPFATWITRVWLTKMYFFNQIYQGNIYIYIYTQTLLNTGRVVNGVRQSINKRIKRCYTGWPVYDLNPFRFNTNPLTSCRIRVALTGHFRIVIVQPIKTYVSHNIDSGTSVALS